MVALQSKGAPAAMTVLSAADRGWVAAGRKGKLGEHPADDKGQAASVVSPSAAETTLRTEPYPLRRSR